MPSYDENGKRLGGAAQIRKRDGAPPEMTRAAKRAFKKLGPAPLAEPLQILGWGRRALAVVAQLLMADQLDGARARSIKDTIFALGSTHNRTELEAEVAQLKKMFGERQQRTTFVYEEAPGRRPKPSTARGMYRPGPRAIPQDALPPDDGDPIGPPPDDDAITQGEIE